MIGMINNSILCHGVSFGDKCPKSKHSELKRLPPELSLICVVGAFGKEEYILAICDSIIVVEDGDSSKRIDMTFNIDSMKKAINWGDNFGVRYEYKWLLACGEITK